VGSLGLGRHGAINAALLATSILALSDETIAAAYNKFREDQTAAVPENPE